MNRRLLEMAVSEIESQEFFFENRDFEGWSLLHMHRSFDTEPSEDHRKYFKALNDLQPGGRLAGLCWRGFGKSTITTIAYVLYQALEHPEQSPHIVVVTHKGNRDAFSKNIRQQLESNPMILAHYGEQRTGTWSKKNIYLKNGVLISFKTPQEKIRGSLHDTSRPHLIILDDIEGSRREVKNKEQRDWFDSYLRDEALPALDDMSGRLVIVGNLLHKDSLMGRIRKRVREEGMTTFEFLEFPLVDDKGRCHWPARYPTKESLKAKEKEVGAISWLREYRLKAVSDDGQPIKESWIRYWKTDPPSEMEYVFGANGVDLAISEKTSADYTSMVSARVYFHPREQRYKILIQKNPVNEQGMSFNDVITRCETQSIATGRGSPTMLFVEDVLFQKAYVQELQRRLVSAEGVNPGGKDKRARLSLVATFVEDGTIEFAPEGNEELILQLTDFGNEEHDDLADAFVYLIFGILKQGLYKMEVKWI